MLGILADDSAHHLRLAVAPEDQAAIFTDRFAGGADFHGEVEVGVLPSPTTVGEELGEAVVGNGP